jgi:beta-glucosidase
MSFEFPKEFLWGAATAAHQVEGNNVHSDFWMLEHAEGSFFAEPSGDACDHFHRYREDIGLLAQLGFGSYRFSVEWARIEPEEGCFSRAALDHYRRVLASCWEHGLTPCVTFHHFTSPRWMAIDGGWEDMRSVDRFARYCERTTEALGDMIGIACTINEANLPISLAQTGVLPEGGAKRRAPFVAKVAESCGVSIERFSPFLMSDPYRTSEVMLAAHCKARDVIRGSRGEFPVGITLAMQDLQAAPGGEAVRDKAREENFGPFLEAARQDDFLGVQTYSRTRFGPEGVLPAEEGVPVLPVGYEFWPEALEGTLRYAAAAAGVPIYVTENGIGTDDDAQRVEYERRAIEGLVRCLEDGIDVRGYYYWSLLDNFEWLHGFGIRFGIISVDRETQRRTPKKSAAYLGEIVRANRFDPKR